MTNTTQADNWYEQTSGRLGIITEKLADVSFFDENELAHIIEAVHHNSHECVTCNFHKQQIDRHLAYLESKTDEISLYVKECKQQDLPKLKEMTEISGYALKMSTTTEEKKEELLGRLIDHLVEAHGYGVVFRFWFYGVLGVVADLVLYALTYFDVVYWLVPFCSLVGFFIGWREDNFYKKQGKVL